MVWTARPLTRSRQTSTPRPSHGTWMNSHGRIQGPAWAPTGQEVPMLKAPLKACCPAVRRLGPVGLVALAALDGPPSARVVRPGLGLAPVPCPGRGAVRAGPAVAARGAGRQAGRSLAAADRSRTEAD